MSFRDKMLKKHVVKADNKWRPDPEDLWDYAQNVEPLYHLVENARTTSEMRDAAKIVVDEYNEAQKDYEPRQFKGSLSDVEDYFLEQFEST